uniref:rhomboid protease n=1 Tax=Hirondellea gigas TaxID=1518452 RepID=A0A2P2I360_9CRUS
MTVLSRLCGGLHHYSGLVTAARCRGRTLSNILHTSRRGFRRQQTKNDDKIVLTPKVEYQTPNLERMPKSLAKCSLFTVGFCSATVVGVTIWEYENLRLKSKAPLSDWVQLRWNDMEGWQSKEGEFRKSLNRWWNGLSEGQKVFWPICFLNILVFLSWHHPMLKLTMMKYFAFSPAADAVCLPMILSTFSHYNVLHLAANMYVMHSFSTPICDKVGKEQFLGMYLCFAVLSSFAGAAFKVIIRSPSPSIGASGAIMGMIGYFCSKYPDSKLGILFIPNFSFSAETGLYSLLAFDTLGLILRFRLFDHAAHLSGALSGLAYARWGEKYWDKRKIIMQNWHSIRQQIENGSKSR